MTNRELRDRLAEYPDDREVVVQGDDGQVEVCENVEEGQFVGSPAWRHGSVYLVISP